MTKIKYKYQSRSDNSTEWKTMSTEYSETILEMLKEYERLGIVKDVQVV